jgi:hypothetical protein
VEIVQLDYYIGERWRLELNLSYAVLINDLDLELPRCDDQALGNLVYAPPQSLQPLLHSGFWVVIPVVVSVSTLTSLGRDPGHELVEQTQGEIAPVSVSGKRHGDHRAQIVDPVQLWLMSREIVPRHEQVDRVRRSGAQRVRQLPANPGGRGRGWKRVGVADMGQTDVAFDVLGELDGIACVPPPGSVSSYGEQPRG